MSIEYSAKMSSTDSGTGLAAMGPPATTVAAFPLPPFLLPQADLLLASARLFYPPSADLTRLASDLAAGGGALVYSAGLPAAYSEKVATILTALPSVIETSIMGRLIAEYVRLFESAAACPLTETAYVRRDKGVVIGDIAGFYRAFGVTVTPQGEKPDHIAAELEFMAALMVMQVQAPTVESAGIARSALYSFAADHAGEWLPSFAAHLAATTVLPFYQQIADLLAGIWQGLAVVHGFDLPETLLGYPTASADNSATNMICGLPS